MMLQSGFVDADIFVVPWTHDPAPMSRRFFGSGAKRWLNMCLHKCRNYKPSSPNPQIRAQELRRIWLTRWSIEVVFEAGQRCSKFAAFWVVAVAGLA